MSSIWKHPNSPFWMACFTANVGLSTRQLKLTTGTADKKLARRIADELEEAARGLRTTDKVKSFLKEIEDMKVRRAAHRAFDLALRHTTGSGLASKTARGFIEGWLERSRGEVSPATTAKYEQVAKLFLSFLGGKADQDLGMIRQDDIARFRDSQAKRVAPSTANGLLKIVRIIFVAAEADGVIAKSEAKHVKRLKVRNEQSSRRSFTLPELKTILAHCDDEWRSLVLFGFYTGARLGDLATLTWQNLNLVKNELAYAPKKSRTQKTVTVPLSKALLRHIQQLPAGDNPKQPLHPRAFAILMKQGRAGVSAGLKMG